jgi:transposase
LLKFGVFIIVSNSDIEKNDILSCYYDRQSIEQFFDYLKNDIDILPLRVHSEASIAAHILISMMATISFIAIDKELKKIGLSVNSSIESCRRLNCRVYQDKLIPDVAVKKVNDVSKALKIKIPNTLMLQNNNFIG